MALQAIRDQFKVKIEVAPGFKDQTITVDYINMTASEMLADLGANYGFTPLPQEPGSFLIIPINPSEPEDETPVEGDSGTSGESILQ